MDSFYIVTKYYIIYIWSQKGIIPYDFTHSLCPTGSKQTTSLIGEEGLKCVGMLEPLVCWETEWREIKSIGSSRVGPRETLLKHLKVYMEAWTYSERVFDTKFYNDMGSKQINICKQHTEKSHWSQVQLKDRQRERERLRETEKREREGEKLTEKETDRQTLVSQG